MTTAILASVAGTSLTDEEKTVLEKLQPAGVSLFGRNIEDKTQLKLLVNSIKEIIGDDVIIAVDQEGGRVRRLAEPNWRSYASQYVLGQLPAKVTEMHAALIAEDMHEIGINFNYAPVLDIAYKQTHEVLKSRCFGKKTAELGKIMAETYVRNGICPCMKHMPGHGRVKTDPHLGLPIIEGDDKALEKDLTPFRENNQLPAGMTAHIVLSQIDNVPVTMSAKAIKEVIRKRIGFDGLLITDAIDMKALSGSIGEKAKTSLSAGCDLVCYCGGRIDDLCELEAQKLYIGNLAAERLEVVKDIIKKPQSDTPSYAEYMAETGRVPAYAETYDATEVLNRMQRA
ncbi:MAG: glycoside hydrolase family 3 N-terminal domain-containing protein [Rhodospirillales bacterium]|nr:glycoside hydrolase family 3 N-terminal domain-containing protein [Rhodospirillales bacterium]